RGGIDGDEAGEREGAAPGERGTAHAGVLACRSPNCPAFSTCARSMGSSRPECWADETPSNARALWTRRAPLAPPLHFAGLNAAGRSAPARREEYMTDRGVGARA